MKTPCLARVLASPVASGRFRTHPADFRVNELLGFEPSGQGEHVFVCVRKIGANTAWVGEQLAKRLGLRRFDVSYAGRKDRHAETVQWFSCWLPGREEPDWSLLDIEGVAVLGAIRHDRKLRRGMHQGNRFEIRLRDLTARPGTAIRQDIEARVDRISHQGVPNYFGEQRFGHDGGNLGFADELLRGGRTSVKKKDLYLSAARSHLFNVALSKRVRAGTWLDEPWGWLPGMNRSGEYTGNAADEALAWRAGFEKLGVRPMRRDWAVVPRDLGVRIEGDDMVLTFALPGGCYATSVLREIVAYE